MQLIECLIDELSADELLICRKPYLLQRHRLHPSSEAHPNASGEALVPFHTHHHARAMPAHVVLKTTSQPSTIGRRIIDVDRSTFLEHFHSGGRDLLANALLKVV